MTMLRRLNVPGGQQLLDTTTTPPDLAPLLTSFVGRQEERARVSGLLERSRLVTLTGPGGVGKTRLAVEVSTDVAGRHRDGAHFVDLTPVSEAGLEVLGDTILPHLVGQDAVVVLDNCDQILWASAALAETLLCSSADVSVLATSREPLGVPGEVIWRLSPLPLGGATAGAPSDAVRLFCERARAYVPDFALSDANRDAVAEICRRLAGIPLAIELAAARVASLAPAEMAARLGQGLDLLGTSKRRGPPRHRSMRAALAWSHDSLPSPERTLIRRVSVFAGSWLLEAAEDVCTGDEVQRAQVCDLLAALVDKSMVVAEAGGQRARYRLFEPVRQYAHDKLVEAGELEALRSRHATWSRELAERAEAEITGCRQYEWVLRLSAEQENLERAMDWAVASGRADVSLRLAGALTLFWRARSQFADGRRRLELALAGGDGESPLPRCKALWGLAFLTTTEGAHSAALPLAEQSLLLARDCGDDKHTARALYVLGLIYTFVRTPAEALPVLEEAVSTARQARDGWCLAASLAAVGRARMFEGDVAEARLSFDHCLSVAREAGDNQGMANALIGLGWAALSRGDYPEAEGLLTQALEASRAVDDAFAEGVVLSFMGELSRCCGDLVGARGRLTEGLALARTAGCPAHVAKSLESLGRVAQAEGDPAEARPFFDEAVSLSEEVGLKTALARPLEGLGEVSSALGELLMARTQLEEALVVARTSGDKPAMARSLHQLGRLARLEGDLERAVALHRETLDIESESNDCAGIAESLEAVAGLAAAQGSCVQSARLFGAAQSLREKIAYARPPAASAIYETDVATARSGISGEEFDTAWAEGAAMALPEALSYATRGRNRRRARPSTGWDALTPAEQDVACLVAEGLTNPQIGARLFISRRTVQAHLSRAFAKLGVKSRWALAKEVTRQAPGPEAQEESSGTRTTRAGAVAGAGGSSTLSPSGAGSSSSPLRDRQGKFKASSTSPTTPRTVRAQASQSTGVEP